MSFKLHENRVFGESACGRFSQNFQWQEKVGLRAADKSVSRITFGSRAASTESVFGFVRVHVPCDF